LLGALDVMNPTRVAVRRSIGIVAENNKENIDVVFK
jgi:hypothetical protein